MSVDTGLRAVINYLGLFLSIALMIYGIVGLQTGQVSAKHDWELKAKPYTGTYARVLSISWIVVGTIGMVAFGGYLLGIKEVVGLHEFVINLLDNA